MSGRALPIVLVPGIQGHWQWMHPTITALRQRHEVRTFSLHIEDGHADPFDQWIARIDQEIDALGAPQVIVMGVSFGGLIATQYAARRPGRVASLVLVSSPSPRMALSKEEWALVNRPLARLPLFAWRGLQRLLPEVLAARRTWRSRFTFLMQHAWRGLRWPVTPRRMARWIRTWQSRDLSAACRQVVAPTVLITGEPALDRVVSVSSTHEYLALIPGAIARTLPRTGHVGLVSRPYAFAALVEESLNGLDDSRSRRTA